MRIERGLFDHMVLQRNGKDVSDAAIAGQCGTAGPVRATVRAGRKALRGLAGVRVGTAARGRFTARLAGVPVGGPYEIELSAGGETLTVRDVHVGDVWLLGGQSNMEGVGLLRNSLPPKAGVRAFYMTDRWGMAADPLHDLHVAVDGVHGRLIGGRPREGKRLAGVGPGLAFGQEMLRRTGVPQGLIACGHGGTSMNQWDPALKKLGGDSLYGAMVRRLVKNGGRVAGLVWYQGESDANPSNCSAFTGKMARFIRAVRRDAGDPALPVAMVQISRVVGWPDDIGPLWNSIQEQQRRLPERVKGVATVPAIDLTMDDLIHISALGHRTLGVRLADAMLWLVGDKTGRPPITVESFTLKEPRPNMAEIHVRFGNVVGGLAAPGRPLGFALGAPLPVSGVFDVQLAGRTAIVRTTRDIQNLKGMSLHYGIGADPVCNIADGAGRSLPVFGPVVLGKPRALTPYIRRLRVSGFLPSAGKLGGLARPDPARLRMTERTFGDFCDIHADVQARGSADELVVFACRIECPEAMRLKLELGYDGPVKAWVDQRLAFHDPNGFNPAQPPDKAKVPFRAAKGRHELIVALGTNHGAAWGVWLRLERLDVPARQRKARDFALPVILG